MGRVQYTEVPSFLKIISMSQRNVCVQAVCVSSESVIVSVTESKVTKVPLPPSPLYSLFFRGRGQQFWGW